MDQRQNIPEHSIESTLSVFRTSSVDFARSPPRIFPDRLRKSESQIAAKGHKGHKSLLCSLRSLAANPAIPRPSDVETRHRIRKNLRGASRPHFKTSSRNSHEFRYSLTSFGASQSTTHERLGQSFDIGDAITPQMKTPSSLSPTPLQLDSATNRQRQPYRYQVRNWTAESLPRSAGTGLRSQKTETTCSTSRACGSTG